MRLILVVLGLVTLPAGQASPQRVPFVPVGVWYDAGPSPGQDFTTIKSLGFNSVRLRAGRAGGEDRLIALAQEAGLRIFVPVDGGPPVVELRSGPVPGSAIRVTSADLRLWGWDAIARGARAIFFSSWSGPGGLVGEDGIVTPRARMAGEFAGIISRNASLFSALRPRTGEHARVRVDGTPDTVEGRFLDSNVATLLIAINRADHAQTVTLRFPPDTPEAIWQNLENGAAVSFVMGKDGPYLSHAFLARDVVVLVRSKRLL